VETNTGRSVTPALEVKVTTFRETHVDQEEEEEEGSSGDEKGRGKAGWV